MRYTAFSLCIDSEIDLPELAPAAPETPVDVTIRLGTAPAQIDPVQGDGVFYTLNHDEFLLTYDPVGTFYVHHGQEIVIQPAQDVDWHFLRLILFDSPIAALLQQRKVFALKASAIETPRGAFLFCGGSVAGKSTLAASFARRGYTVIADTTCIIAIDQDQSIGIYSDMRVQRLWLEAVEHLEIDSTQLIKTLPHKNLFTLPLEPLDRERFTPVHLFDLSFSNNVGIMRLEPVTGLGKLETLARLSYFHFFLNQMGRATQFHPLLVQLISQLPLTRLQREAKITHNPAIVDHIEQHYIL